MAVVMIPPQVLYGLPGKFTAQQTFAETIVSEQENAVTNNGSIVGLYSPNSGAAQGAFLLAGTVQVMADAYSGTFRTIFNGAVTIDLRSDGSYYNWVNGIQVAATPALSNPAVASGTVYQNTTTRYLTIDLPTYATTSGTAGSLAFARGTTSSPAANWTDLVPGDTTSSATRTFTLRIPPGFYWSVTATGATLGTPTQIEE